MKNFYFAGVCRSKSVRPIDDGVGPSVDEFFTLAIGGMRASALEQRATLPIRVSARTPTPTRREAPTLCLQVHAPQQQRHLDLPGRHARVVSSERQSNPNPNPNPKQNFDQVLLQRGSRQAGRPRQGPPHTRHGQAAPDQRQDRHGRQRARHRQGGNAIAFANHKIRAPCVLIPTLTLTSSPSPSRARPSTCF